MTNQIDSVKQQLSQIQENIKDIQQKLEKNETKKSKNGEWFLLGIIIGVLISSLVLFWIYQEKIGVLNEKIQFYKTQLEKKG